METVGVNYKSIPVLSKLFKMEEQSEEKEKFYRVIMNKKLNGDYNIKTICSSGVHYITKRTWYGKKKVVRVDDSQELSVGIYAMKEGNFIYEASTGKRLVVPTLDTEWDDKCIYCYGVQELKSKEQIQTMIKDRELLKGLSDFDFKTYKYHVENKSNDVKNYVSSQKMTAEMAERIMNRAVPYEEKDFQYINENMRPKRLKN